MLLAIDPGMNSPGVALFREGVLVDAARVPVPSGLADFKEDGQRWHAVALTIVAWLNRPVVDGRGTMWSIIDLVYEKPQFYQRKQGGSKGDPSKLAGVLAVACNLAGMVSRHTYVPLNITTPEPARWIGQISKECPTCVAARAAKKGKKKAPKWFAKDCPACHGSAWETPRGRRIRSRLSPAELALVPDQNDAIDAVGLGLWALGRLEPQRNYTSE